MISLLISGHNYQHDLYELIRAFLPEEEILFLDRVEEYSKVGYLIKSSLYEDKKGFVAISEISLYDDTLYNYKVDINSININHYSQEQLFKLAIKGSLFQILSNLTKNNMPWGILTGIRPNKIMHNLLDLGYSNNKAIEILSKEYKINKIKAELLNNISKIQRKHLYPIDNDKYSIYISIPFCPSICSYCSFSSLPINKYNNFVEEYVNNLIYEIQETSKLVSKKKLNTVYIGGGTPTSISTVFLDRIIYEVYKNFGENILEFTVEAGRPDTINYEVLTMLRNYNINRISINPQTMEDRTLKAVGRTHNSRDVVDAYNLAKKLGFSIINMDLILGLPGEGIEEVKRTLSKIKELDPENLTIHNLSLKRGSFYKKNIDEINPIKQSGINMEDQIQEYINEMELYPYYLYRQKQISGNLENIGYSKKNMECLYNISMMEEKETIIGLGMGAVSKFYNPITNRIKRIPNFKGINDYINRIDELIKNKKEVLL